MLADDHPGAQREGFQSLLPQSYYDAFAAIARDPHNELVVATVEGRIVGVLQLTFIPSLTYQGGWRALIEGVRVASEFRAQGIARTMFQWAVQRGNGDVICSNSRRIRRVPMRCDFMRAWASPPRARA